VRACTAEFFLANQSATVVRLETQALSIDSQQVGTTGSMPPPQKACFGSWTSPEHADTLVEVLAAVVWPSGHALQLTPLAVSEAE
jgi:hypothetical protein